MSANSEMWAQTNDKTLKDQLHAENLYLASKYGLTFDSKTGNYYHSDGTPVYLSAKQQLSGVRPIQSDATSVIAGQIGYDSYGNPSSASSLRTYNGVTYDVNVDYAAKIQEAYNAGYYYGDDYFMQLLSLRDAKVKGEGLDPETGKKISATKSTVIPMTTTEVINSTVNAAKNSKVSYDRNIDYAALINEAKANGASAAVIAQLTAQREAKIAGENLNRDGTKKTSSSSSSSKSGAGRSMTSSQKTTKTTASSGGVTYDKNVDYAAAINKAVKEGKSQSYIDQLQRQRQAKIKGENLNNDGTKKK